MSLNPYPLPRHWLRLAQSLYHLFPTGGDDATWGTGLSIGQLVSASTGVFVRAVSSRTESESLTAHAWSLGVVVLFCGR